MIALYGHPFASFVWKPLIAAYERGVAFEFRMVDGDHPDHAAFVADAAPTGQFPVLTDGDRTVIESSAIVEWLDRQGDAASMVPRDPVAGIEARQMDGVFDDYVQAPMQRIVADSLRGDAPRDPTGVAMAKDALLKVYGWLDRRMAGRDWAAGDFGLADCAAAPALFYADWVQPIPEAMGTLRAYRARLLDRPSVARVVDEARPYRHFFPLGAPDRD